MIIKAVILGIVEGLTEFLPVSSTGHLIIANQFFSFEGSFEAMFDIVIQFGAILAVVVYFRKDIFPLKLKDKGGLKADSEVERVVRLWKKIIIGFLPAAVIGVMIDEILEKYLFNTTSVSIALLTGALLMIIAERRKKASSVSSPKRLQSNRLLLSVFFSALLCGPECPVQHQQ